MAKELEYTFFSIKSYTNGQQPLEKVLCVVILGKCIGDTTPLTSTGMAIIKLTKKPNSKCWQRCGETRTFVDCWWECKMVLLWRTVWKLLKKLKLELP